MKKFLFSFIIAILIITFCCSCKAAVTTTTENDKNTVDTDTCVSNNNTTKISSENNGITLHGVYKGAEFADIGPIETCEYMFPNGTTMFAADGNAKTIVMINGTYQPDIEVKMIDNVLMVPIKIVCECLNIEANVIEKNNKITIKNNLLTIKIKVADTNALVNNEKVALELPAQVIDNAIYVPWNFMYDKLDVNSDYYNSWQNHLLAFNPIITIDKKSNIPYLSKKEGYEYLKNNLDESYNHFEENYKKLYNPDDDRIDNISYFLKQDIDNIKLIGNISKYYVFEGLAYTIFLDKYNKDVYFNIQSIGEANIKKIEFDDPKLFEYAYMVD